MQWFAQAPANIALIKYMGKSNEQLNQAANSSLSYTLNHLQSHVVLEESNHDSWEPLDGPNILNQPFSEQARLRFLNHLSFLKEQFQYTGSFRVRSGNNFPHGSGLASSASSFAALTQCAALACSALTEQPLASILEQAKLSQQGSGSSCRSFFAPWALWEADHVSAINLPYTELLHQVILIDPSEKKVSSSQAHQRIKTSEQYSSRPERANNHLTELLEALYTKQWEKA